MQSVRLVLGGLMILGVIGVAVGLLPKMMEQQQARRAALKSQLIEYSKFK